MGTRFPWAREAKVPRKSERILKARHLVELLGLLLNIVGAAGSSAGGATGGSTAVGSGDDGVGNALKLLLLGLVLVLLSGLVVIEPRDDLVDLVLNLLLVILGDLELALRQGVLEGVSVALKAVLGLDMASLSLRCSRACMRIPTWHLSRFVSSL